MILHILVRGLIMLGGRVRQFWALFFIVILKGESMLWWCIFNKKMDFFLGTFCIFLKVDFLSFHLTFWETHKKQFWHKAPNKTNCYLSNDSVFSTNFYVFTHLRLFEWKTLSKCFSWNHMSGTLHIKLKWGSEFICNIWLNTPSSLVIIWMV